MSALLPPFPPFSLPALHKKKTCASATPHVHMPRFPPFRPEPEAVQLSSTHSIIPRESEKNGQATWHMMLAGCE